MKNCACCGAYPPERECARPAATPASRTIRKRKPCSACSMPAIGVGLITDPDLAEHAVASGQADLVAVGRGMLFNPHWPWLAAARLGARVIAPNQYLRAAPHGMSILEGR